MTESTKDGMASWATGLAHLGRHLSADEWERVYSGESLVDSPKLMAVRAAAEQEKDKSLKSDTSAKL